MTARDMGSKHVPMAMDGVIGDPTSYREGIQSEEEEKWRDAMRSEFDSLKENGTGELIIRPPGQNILHSKWVFKTKKLADGALKRFKVRLKACGNEQAYGVDYTLTFSSLMDLTAANVVVALARVW